MDSADGCAASQRPAARGSKGSARQALAGRARAWSFGVVCPHHPSGQGSRNGYECNLAYNGGYAEVVRWNGPLGDYTYVSSQGSGGPGAVQDGDVFAVQIVGTTVTTWLNGHQLQHVDMASIGGTLWTDGNPGMGFWRGAGASAAAGDYGCSSYAATSRP